MNNKIGKQILQSNKYYKEYKNC